MLPGRVRRKKDFPQKCASPFELPRDRTNPAFNFLSEISSYRFYSTFSNCLVLFVAIVTVTRQPGSLAEEISSRLIKLRQETRSMAGMKDARHQKLPENHSSNSIIRYQSVPLLVHSDFAVDPLVFDRFLRRRPSPTLLERSNASLLPSLS